MEEEVGEEREGVEGGQHLLALTNFVNTNDSLSNCYGNDSPGSNGRENFKGSLNVINDHENLNSSNSKVGESLGEELKGVVNTDSNESSEIGLSKGPSNCCCHCSHRSNYEGVRLAAVLKR
jgi:hypothetical protein